MRQGGVLGVPAAARLLLPAGSAAAARQAVELGPHPSPPTRASPPPHGHRREEARAALVAAGLERRMYSREVQAWIKVWGSVPRCCQCNSTADSRPACMQPSAAMAGKASSTPGAAGLGPVRDGRSRRRCRPPTHECARRRRAAAPRRTWRRAW